MPFLNTKYFREIEDLQEVDSLDESLSWAIRHQIKPRQMLIEITLFKLSGWLAVPVSSEDFASPTFQIQLYKALFSHKYFNLYALIPMSNKGLTVYSGPLALSIFSEFDRQMGFFYPTLFSGLPEPEFVIASIESDYFVVAGKADFIDRVFVGEMEAYYSRFQDFAVDNFFAGFPGNYASSLEKELSLLCHQLKDEYGKAEVGAEFRL